MSGPTRGEFITGALCAHFPDRQERERVAEGIRQHLAEHADASQVETAVGAEAMLPPGPASSCPHCPDGHRDPAQANWGVFVASERDGDGQPTHLRVEKVNGSHVSESDAAWLWQLIRWATTDGEESCEPVHRPALGTSWGRTGRAG